jgi:hypothetical protein
MIKILKKSHVAKTISRFSVFSSYQRHLLMKFKKIFHQNDQREELYKLGYVKTFSEIFVFFVVEYP